ncbi:MAG TPA: hypothetical protein VFX15_09800 [Actinomycetes bacterium]|nr:hypothetical protein [Actinomycetes bacterium]
MADIDADRERLGRLCDRLRSMAEPALTRPREQLEGQSVATAVHELCTWAAAAMGVAGPVPVLHPFATGDQLTVIGREFLDWCAASDDEAVLRNWRAWIDRLRAAT